ncbi:MAG TPA: bifunctional hydroxymethylpyrimidine kinase/phosphomethylpyrimidine kinase [bacterium]|nr:bifunctional hydroxymethylpyrimidine kinase/phosphomethylpyrimidine kinase [bacterium]HPJ72739.1 bifunctional hydroxymethylpyrimidine kinase/phosphomethylpyrimidine kinase [bacterium]HPQ67021.1 bifunctional hydroxymethylpyrimidine kinase/phosphomethylpyrimidine kinase [bacterium]
MAEKVYSALTIAGSDSGGGAGIQADLKTFEAFGVFGTTAVTAVTAQNTRGVEAVVCLEPDFVGAQIEAVARDMHPSAVKTGMLANAGIIREVAARIRSLKLPNLVVDPVMVATSGDRLLEKEAVRTLISELLPLARVVTPNLEEARILAGFPVADAGEMLAAARAIAGFGAAAVVVKAGHGSGPADDLFWDGKSACWLRSPRLTEEPLHGTGCTFSAALAAGLARGLEARAAAEEAKAYMCRAIGFRRRPGAGAATVGWKAAAAAEEPR